MSNDNRDRKGYKALDKARQSVANAVILNKHGQRSGTIMCTWSSRGVCTAVVHFKEAMPNPTPDLETRNVYGCATAKASGYGCCKGSSAIADCLSGLGYDGTYSAMSGRGQSAVDAWFNSLGYRLEWVGGF